MRDGDEARREAAAAIWRRAGAITGTPVEVYLRGRGLEAARIPTLRANRTKHAPSARHLWTMVAAVQHEGHAGVSAVARTYLDDAGHKSTIEPVRMMLGHVAGGAVRLARATDQLIVAEGIETALSVLQATRMPAWAALSAVGIRRLVLPALPLASEVLIAADHDAEGIQAAQAAAGRWRGEGRRVHIAVPPEPGADFNDILLDRAEASG